MYWVIMLRFYLGFAHIFAVLLSLIVISNCHYNNGGLVNSSSLDNYFTEIIFKTFGLSLVKKRGYRWIAPFFVSFLRIDLIFFDSLQSCNCKGFCYLI